MLEGRTHYSCGSITGVFVPKLSLSCCWFDHGSGASGSHSCRSWGDRDGVREYVSGARPADVFFLGMRLRLWCLVPGILLLFWACHVLRVRICTVVDAAVLVLRVKMVSAFLKPSASLKLARQTVSRRLSAIEGCHAAPSRPSCSRALSPVIPTRAARVVVA